VDRAGLRLKLLAQQAAAGDLVLLFADEAECLTHPYLAYVWARRGEDLRLPAPGQAQRRALLGAFDAARHELVVVTSARKRSADFLLLLARLDRLHGPAPGRPERPVVLVLDNGPIHTSKATAKALAARPWLTVKWLPKYAPELNAIEHRWRDLKAHFLAHQTFASADHLDAAIHWAVQDLNRERQTQTCSPRPMQGCLEPWLEHSEQLIGKATASYTSASSS
jgi:transposase